MITGSVNANREAIILLTVSGPSGQEQIEAVIDTGFTGFLTLSSATIALLGCPFNSRGQVVLGDGRVEIVDIYTATVDWDGTLQTVEVESADINPLVGMSLLDGYELNIQAVSGGAVTINVL